VANLGTSAAVPSSEASTTITTTAGASVGDLVVVRVAADNSGTAGAAPTLTVTDTRSNTWTTETAALADPGNVNAGACAFIAWTNVTTAIQTSDTITLAWSPNVSAKAATADAYAGFTGVDTQEVTASGTGTAVSVASNSVASGALVVVAVAIEARSSGATNDADTTNGTWDANTILTADSGTGNTSMQLAHSKKTTTGAGVQTFDTTITSNDWAAIIMSFAPSAAATSPPPRRRRHDLLIGR
jgi:hypothetical protein